MKKIFLPFLIFWLSSATALASFGNDVKIKVTRCSNGASITAGSGIGFVHDQSGYVLTSEHVVTVKSDVCYSAINAGSKMELRAEVISSDWANGLALLRLRTAAPAGFVSLEQTFDLDGVTDNEVMTSGFAQSSDQISKDRARVVINGSLRGGFVGNVKLLEMIGPIAEYGMSGGAVRNSRNEKVIGLISHQRLFLTPGKPSLVASEGEVSQMQSNHFFVISSHSILEWTQNTLQGAKAQYSRISEELVKGMGVVFKQPATSDRLILAKGGGDGVGATGKEEDADRPGITVEVAIADMTELNSSVQASQNFESEWLKSLATDILRKQKLEFTHLLTVNPATNDIKLKPIFSIAHMISAIRSGHALPIPKTQALSGQNPELEALKSALTVKSDSAEVMKLLEIVRKLIEVKIQNPATRLPQNYFNILEKHVGWDDFADQDFDKAILAKQFLLSFSVRNGLAR